MTPPPSYAATVWIVDQTLMVAMQSPVPGARGSTVAFSADEYGIKCLLLLLRERERAKAAQRVGVRSDPTQYDIEAIYAAIKNKKAEPKPKPKLSANVLSKLRKTI